MARKRRFQGRRIDSTCLRWAFCSAKHGWKYFLTLNSFPAPIRDFKNLKGTWHQMLARSRQLQGIFGLLKPFLHVQILICFVDVYQNHGVFVHLCSCHKFRYFAIHLLHCPKFSNSDILLEIKLIKQYPFLVPRNVLFLIQRRRQGIQHEEVGNGEGMMLETVPMLSDPLRYIL